MQAKPGLGMNRIRLTGWIRKYGVGKHATINIRNNCGKLARADWNSGAILGANITDQASLTVYIHNSMTAARTRCKPETEMPSSDFFSSSTTFFRVFG